MTTPSKEHKLIVSTLMGILSEAIDGFRANPCQNTAVPLLRSAIASHEVLSEHFGYSKKYEHLVEVTQMMFGLEGATPKKGLKVRRQREVDRETITATE